MHSRLSFLTLLSFFSISCWAQGHGFAFGKVTLEELNMKQYARDTSAVAVVLNEFGEAYFDKQDFTLMFEYHVKIKILKPEGLSFGDFSIPLYKGSSNKVEELLMLKGSVFNLTGGNITEDKLETRKVFTENQSKYYDVKKFAMPNVRAGGVIEVAYTTKSPFIYNFHGWEFQSSIPKTVSEFWAEIPGNYTYNIQLKGFLKLTKNESSLVKTCIGSGAGYGTGFSADCSLLKYGMRNIPAFIEEDYMTSRNNFLSAISFELAQLQHFDGQVEKVTKEWKDVEKELSLHNDFGKQLKKGKEIGKQLDLASSLSNDPLEKAKKIYRLISRKIKWNEIYGFFSTDGIKKAFEAGTGSIGDINLALVAALDYAGLKAEPMLLSTRSNGLATELYPVLSEFNYVVAKLNLNDKVYLLDASDPYLFFGMLPERCLNGKGRVFGDQGSYWYDIKPSEKDKQVSVYNLTLESSGIFSGTVSNSYYGYKSIEKRKEILSQTNQEEYIKELQKENDAVAIGEFEIQGLDDIEGAVQEKLNIKIEGYDNLNAEENLLLNPFLGNKIVDENPFHSAERLYPVDFGAPLEITVVLNLSYPKEFELISRPETLALSIPNSGGRFLFDITGQGEGKLAVSYSLAIQKTVYDSKEYHYLKELFARIIQTQNADMIFSRVKK